MNATAPTIARIAALFPEFAGITVDQGKVVAPGFGGQFTTAFQPWRRAADGAIVAWEAYARPLAGAADGESPWRRQAAGEIDAGLIALDRICRTVHVLNYLAHGAPLLPLVLNVDARFLHAVPDRHGEFFGQVLAALGVAPQRIVIETRTSNLFDLSRFREVIDSYRSHGFQVAINAEGLIHARTLAEVLAPDHLMVEADLFGAPALRALVAALKPTGVAVAAKCIAREELAVAARCAGVAWVQGFFFDRPSPLE